MKPRLRIVPAALALTLAATAWVSAMDQDPGDDEAPARPRAAAGRAAGTAGDAAGPAAAAADVSAHDKTPTVAPARRGPWSPVPARALAAWGPAASAANNAAAAPPAASAASQPAPPPRFPYTWIGRIDTGSEVQVLLNGPQRSFGARAGEVLDGRWRIEQVAATRLQLTWLPTGETVMVDAR